MKKLIILFGLFTGVMSCHRMPEKIWIDKAGLYPEGLEYDYEKDRFLVTSLKEGIIGEVNKQGEFKKIIEDSNMISAIGIRFDKKRNRILVANSDPGVSIKTSVKTQKKIAGLGIFNASDGKLIHYIDLSALLPKNEHFANDIALDETTGTVYVTDSFAPAIYKVDVDGNASVFLKNKRFEGQGFNLNGIVIYKDFLLTVKDNDGSLFKIPLNDPEKFTEVKLDEKLTRGDGIILKKNGNLLINANASLLTVFELKSDDDYKSAKIIAKNSENWNYNTTGVMVCGKPYVLNAQLDQLFGGKPDVTQFEIRRVKF